MTKKVLLFIMVFSLSFFFPKAAVAAKKRVWKVTPVSKGAAAATKPGASVSLRKDYQALIINFYGLNLTNSVSYELTYVANGIEQGVFGAVSPSEGNSTSKTLYFGTCSHAVCTPHKNLKQMRLTISFRLKTGKTLIKKYKVKRFN